MTDRAAALRALQARLGHVFGDASLLERALTHTSLANEEPLATHNESLEFLGDAVLGFLVADLLHRRDPDGTEGGKSKARAHLVAAASLALRAEALGLPPLLRLGRGEEKTGGRHKANLWADAYEAVIAALYLDGGLETARAFVAAEFEDDLGRTEDLPSRDHKSALQELLQGRGDPPPEYVLVAEEGPDHRKSFRVRCDVAGRPLAEGLGHSKKEAQQDAARLALLALAPTPSAPS
jgi:ribonuclease-3